MSKFTDNIKKVFSQNTPNHAELPMGSGVNVWGTQQWFKSPLVGKYSDIYFYTIINKIFSGLRNCRFVDLSDTDFVSTIRDFVEGEITHIVWNYWRDGYVVVESTKKGYAVVDNNKTDKDGVVILGKNQYVYYGDLYKLKRESTFNILQSELALMDRTGSASDFLTSTYGSMCLITGNTMPMSKAEKEELNTQLKTSLGITADRNQFVISQAKDLNFRDISFDVKGLALDEKIKDQYLLLADYFNVPKNILSSDTDSTYENQKAALRRFYSDCISPLCEIVLSIGRMLIMQSNIMIPSTELTFVFDNVPEISCESEFVQSINDLLSIVSNENLSPSARRKLQDIINQKIEDYQ